MRKAGLLLLRGVPAAALRPTASGTSNTPLPRGIGHPAASGVLGTRPAQGHQTPVPADWVALRSLWGLQYPSPLLPSWTQPFPHPCGQAGRREQSPLSQRIIPRAGLGCGQKLPPPPRAWHRGLGGPQDVAERSNPSLSGHGCCSQQLHPGQCSKVPPSPADSPHEGFWGPQLILP